MAALQRSSGNDSLVGTLSGYYTQEGFVAKRELIVG